MTPTGPRGLNAIGEGNGRLLVKQQFPQGTGQAPLDLLLSYAFHGALDHHRMHRALPTGSMVWIDSGAYTAYTTGKRLHREQYLEHLTKNAGGYDYAFSLDVIGDGAASRRNTEWFWEHGVKVVPVFHYGSPIAEYRSLCRDYGYVAAGGLVPIVRDRTRVAKYLRHLTRIAAEHDTAVHALGVAGRDTVIRTAVWSADSSTVSSAPMFGHVPIYDRRRKRLVMLSAADPDGLWNHRNDLLHYDFPLDAVMRGRKWTKGDRPAMFRASLLSVADLWDGVRQRHHVPPPGRLWAPEGERNNTPPAGPRTASAMTTSEGVKAAMGEV